MAFLTKEIRMEANKSSGCLGAEQIFLFAVSLSAVFVSSVTLAVVSLLFLPLKLLRLTLRIASTKLSVLLIAGAVAAFLGTVIFLNRPGPGVGQADVVIEEGMSAAQIGGLLQAKGIVASRSFFTLMAKLYGLENKLRAGKYHFVGPTTVLSALERLRAGGALIQQITIPEGLTVRQIAAVFQGAIQVDSASFVALTRNRDFCRKLGISAPNLEGYLFPDTYRFYWKTSEEKILETMAGRFHSIFADSLRQRATQIGMTVHQVVTLASIIEKEAQVPEERPLISAVFHRRLKLGMPLQADPTVIYALGGRKRKLSKADTRVNSPYNTYLHRGLPPGPICNPGRGSILAALYPAKVDYLYFVAKGDGTHIFTKSLNAHINAKNRVKRMRKYGIDKIYRKIQGR